MKPHKDLKEETKKTAEKIQEKNEKKDDDWPEEDGIYEGGVTDTHALFKYDFDSFDPSLVSDGSPVYFRRVLDWRYKHPSGLSAFCAWDLRPNDYEVIFSLTAVIVLWISLLLGLLYYTQGPFGAILC
jgi:hypothetical protein